MRRGTTVAALVAAAAVVVGCSSGGAEPASPPAAGGSAGESQRRPLQPARQDGLTLTFSSYGGAFQDAEKRAWQEPYTELTGVQFANDENSSNATIRAQVESGQVTWDVVDVGNDFGLDAHKELLEPLDYSLIPRDELNADLGVTDYRVPVITYGTVLAANTDQDRRSGPSGLGGFLRYREVPGQAWRLGLLAGRHLRDRPPRRRRRAGRPLPARSRRATAKLDAIKDDVVFWASGAESRELIGSGEVAMSMIWNGRAWYAIHEDNRPVEIEWNQQIVSANYYVVPKGTPNREAAMRFIAYATCAEQQRRDLDVHPVRAHEHQLGTRSRDGRGPRGQPCRREHGVLR